jgi:hypothetical protein
MQYPVPDSDDFRRNHGVQLIVMKTIIFLLISSVILLAADDPRKPDDCSWENTSKARKLVKTRSAEVGKSYINYNEGKPITIAEWYRLTCSLDAKVPDQIPAYAPIEGAETMRVIVRGYLLGAHFERDGDHDMQAEIAAGPEWNTDHVLLELAPGTEYCEARHSLWQLVRKDGCKTDQCILRKPVEVLVTGYLLLGGAQGTKNYCQAPSTRGMHKGNEGSMIRGAWRLQPVFAVRRV